VGGKGGLGPPLAVRWGIQGGLPLYAKLCDGFLFSLDHLLWGIVGGISPTSEAEGARGTRGDLPL
jgi:hypothetical protein